MLISKSFALWRAATISSRHLATIAASIVSFEPKRPRKATSRASTL